MVRYLIDYGWSVAQFWTQETEPEKVLADFHNKAGECFGLRKSITREPRILSQGPAELPDWAPHGTAVAMTHNPPLEDRVAWDAAGVKVRNEWGDDERAGVR